MIYMKEIREEPASSAKEGVIEIPIGKYVGFFKNSFGKARHNPWIASTFVLALALVFVLIFGGFGKSFTGNVVSENIAGNNLIGFINSQGNGEASLLGVKKSEGFYEVNVLFQGQEIPVFVTLDGRYLIPDKIPLGSNFVSGGGSKGINAGPVDVNIEGAYYIGNKDAKVTVVEFTDYECPFCGRHYSESYLQLKRDYIDTGKILYVVRDFPLGFHSNAQKAAEAARCVGEQKGNEGYFKMHDKLFENQQSLSIENYQRWAREIGVDGAKFDSCLSSGKYFDAVQSDEKYGQTLGVSGTPSSFINGVQIEGAVPYSSFKQAIEAELAK